MNLSGNTVLITGGTSGIGLELGRALLKNQNTVILLGRNGEKLGQLENEGFATIACNLANQSEVETASVRIQNEFSEINMLFNNAGVQYNYDFTGQLIPLDKIADEVAVNITGQLVLTQLLIPHLSTKKRAYIINTTSGLAAYPKVDGLVYSATKAAMRNFTVGLRNAMAVGPVKVLEFIPPVTETEMTRGRAEAKMSAHELIQKILPQLEKERTILTVPKMRMFLWIAFIFPSLARKIISK